MKNIPWILKKYLAPGWVAKKHNKVQSRKMKHEPGQKKAKCKVKLLKHEPDQKTQQSAK